MSEGRDEKLNGGNDEPTKGQLALGEYIVMTGYVAFFGENNTEGEPVLEDGLVLRKPKWLGTELGKDELGVTMVVAVPKQNMPAEQPNMEVSALQREVAELKSQLRMPLTPANVTMLKSVLSDEKVKLGSREECLAGLDLIEVLDGYLNPKLDFDKKEEAAETTDAAPSNPEADDADTE